MQTSMGMGGENKAVRIMRGIERCNGTFRQIWRMTGLQEHELEGELEVLRHLGFVELVPKGGGGGKKGKTAGRAGSALYDAPGAAYRLTEKGRRAFSSFC